MLGGDEATGGGVGLLASLAQAAVAFAAAGAAGSVPDSAAAAAAAASSTAAAGGGGGSGSGGAEEQQQLIRSDKAKSGYKGVYADQGRYQAQCSTPPCSKNHLGIFDTPENAAQSYLQHWETKHPEELEEEQAPPPVLPEVQEHLLIRSDKSKSGIIRE